MPLYKTIHLNKNTTVALWKVAESEAFLAEGIILSEHCQARFNSMKSEMHRRAFLSVRHLLALYNYKDKDLIYDAVGKPFLKDGTHISITHSHNFTGIILSKTLEVGIDIEKQRTKILAIAHKFTTLYLLEKNSDETVLIKKLTIVWGIKEALYKIYGKKGISFYNHIVVADFSLEDTIIKAEINFEEQILRFHTLFFEFEGFICVCANLLIDKTDVEIS